MDMGLSKETHRGIHEKIRKFTTVHAWLLGPAAIVLGAIVSSMELVCTGQILLPVLTVLMKDGITDLQISPLEQTITWTVEDIQGEAEKELRLDLANSALAAWDGLKTFRVELSVESGDCLIGANNAATVSIVSKPYLENSEIVFGQLFENVLASTAKTVYVGLPGELTVESEDLPDWAHASISIEGFGRIIESTITESGCRACLWWAGAWENRYSFTKRASGR